MCQEQAYIVPIFFTYALAGLPTFYYALNKMTYITGKLFGKWAKRIFPILMIPITTIGLMLGLFARFNSWDIASHPFAVIQEAAGYLTNGTMLLNFTSYTVMLYLVYYFIRSVRKFSDTTK